MMLNDMSKPSFVYSSSPVLLCAEGAEVPAAPTHSKGKRKALKNFLHKLRHPAAEPETGAVSLGAGTARSS